MASKILLRFVGFGGAGIFYDPMSQKINGLKSYLAFGGFQFNVSFSNSLKKFLKTFEMRIPV